MKKKIKVLLILYFIIGFTLSMFLTNIVRASEINAYGNELVNIEDTVGGGEEEAKYTSETPATVGTMTDVVQEYFDTVNTSTTAYTGNDVEAWLEQNLYTYENLVSFKHNQNLKSAHDQLLNLPHATAFNLYERIVGIRNVLPKDIYNSGNDWDAEAKTDKSKLVFKSVYDAHSTPAHTNDIATRTVRSNYSIKELSLLPKDLQNIETDSKTYQDAYALIYITAFSDKAAGVDFDPATEAQKALWGVTGCVGLSCDHKEEDLYLAAMAAEKYQLDTKTKEVKITLPTGAQVGTAYYDTDWGNYSIAYQGYQAGEISAGDAAALAAGTVVRVGPFKTNDYAYVLSEYAGKYSNKGLEYPDVVGGIVGGHIVVSGTTVEIGTEAGNARIVYKDWYDYQAYNYAGTNQDDARGDKRGEDTTWNGSTKYATYAPKFEGTITARRPSADAREEYSNPGNSSDPMKVYIQENGEKKEYPFPLPNSVFYVEIPLSAININPGAIQGSARWLNDIVFEYRTTDLSGTGKCFITKCVETTTTFSSSSDATDAETVESVCGKGSYSHKYDDNTGCECGGGHKIDNCPSVNNGTYCRCVSGSYKCGKTEHTHKPSCWVPNYNDLECDTEVVEHDDECFDEDGDPTNCEDEEHHEHDDDCYGVKCKHGLINHTHKTCPGHKITGCLCYCPGHDDCGTTTYDGDYALCKHGHKLCAPSYWTTTVKDVIFGQPLVRLQDPEVLVEKTECTSGVDVAMFVGVEIEKNEIYSWHGWDTMFDTGLDIELKEDEYGVLDDLFGWIFNDDEIKPISVGDALSYRVIVHNYAGVDLYLKIRDVYPEGMVANDDTRVVIYKSNYGWNSGKNDCWTDPQTWVVEGGKTTAATSNKAAGENLGEIKVPANSHVFFKVNYIITKDYNENASNSVQLACSDNKIHSSGSSVNVNNTAVHNIDFPRTHYEEHGDERHYGPVIMNAKVINPPPPVIKEYIVNVNKYIYDVKHVNTKGVNSTMTSGTGRFNEAEQEIYNVATLKGVHQTNENNKKDNPVYVEYGDRVTYKIEISNDTIVRGIEGQYTDNPDLLYVSIKDTLPKKYSDLKIESIEESDPSLNQGAHYKAPTGFATDSNSGGTLEFYDIAVPANGKTTITISLTVEEFENYADNPNVIEQNKAELIMNDAVPVYNINRGDKAEPMRDVWCVVNEFVHYIGDSSDWYVLNDYDIDIDKYISSYNRAKLSNNNNAGLTRDSYNINSKGFDNNFNSLNSKNIEDLDRINQTDLDKYNNPVHVEKGERIAYSIRLTNNSTTVGSGFYGGDKKATQVRVDEIEESHHSGLAIKYVKAYIYDDSGARRREVKISYNTSANPMRITLQDPNDRLTIIEPNEYIIYYVIAEVTESNMSLARLENSAKIIKLTNINNPNNENKDRVVMQDGDPKINENRSPQKESKDYVRMKDLVIAGYVWLDKNQDGKMSADDATALKATGEDELYNAKGSEGGKAGVKVHLYRLDGDVKTKLRTVTTNSEGRYTFSNAYDGTEYSSLPSNGLGDTTPVNYIGGGHIYNRIDKADGKDQYGNNEPSDPYINYYIEFEYDGVIFRSTELYAGEDGKKNLSADGSVSSVSPYRKDSNAYEISSQRAWFNTQYQYISYDSAYVGPSATLAEAGKLTFKKNGHTSVLKENPARVMTSRSFINKTTNENNLLWFYTYNGGSTPNTEYLKYINLGLELREDVDLALTKDVYKVKTTVNGESIEYDFNENTGVNGTMGNGTSGYWGDYIINEPYGLEIYESDYKFRVDQYFSDEVKKYKDFYSEMNIEVTYRIQVNNVPTTDDDTVPGNANNSVGDVKFVARVNEIMDVYEDNFIALGEKTSDTITVKTRTDEGLLVDTSVKTIEAWYYKADGTRQDLTVSAGSKFNNNGVNYTSKGYHKLFITGMDGVEIPEGSGFDFYVKYTLDKGKTTVEVTNSNYAETKSETKNSGILGELGDMYDAEGTYTETIVVSGTTATMQRSLKIKEILEGRPNARGIANIAQLNGYSIWYPNGTPASLVDKDSNAGNVGTKGTDIDDYNNYEDMVYKTGVVIAAEGTGWGKTETQTIYGELEFKGRADVHRYINGTVWDDSRSDTLGSSPEIQYIGDGMLDPAESKNANAIINENVEINYEGTENATENNDFPVRDIKAEFIEIIKLEDETGNIRYYEQVLKDVTWEQIQHTRTGYDINGDGQVKTYTNAEGKFVYEEGAYQLEGFVPGTYIVRFTYGDTTDESARAKKNMQVFNGQDYKSTKFGTKVTDNTTDVDEIMAAIEVAGSSDARDDERRRLEVNSYSEVMTNQKAEILKGVGNGAKRKGTNTTITTNDTQNTTEQLEFLTDNTYMYADTIEFLVKSEKLTTSQQELRGLIITEGASVKDILYDELEAIKKDERNAREFRISNIDFGIEYRPESEIRLVKEIEEVKLITEDGDTLVDLFFLTKGEGETTEHVIDKSKSKGLELVQFVTNTYNNELLNRLTNEKKQGFVFVQIDEEILQGCTVQIIYKFEAENNSEVDRIAVNLDKIRYKENPAAKDLLAKYEKARNLAIVDYTASGVAAKAVEEETFTLDPQGLEYRTRPKTMVEETMTAEEIEKSYYGRFVGYGYYTGEESILDTVASLKFDKILDYVDVNLEYKQESEQANTLDKFWTRVKTEDLKSLIYPVRSKLEANPGNPVEELQNGRGHIYDTLLVSVDDRIKDDKYSTKYSSFTINEETDNIRNNDLSRFLLPKDTVVDKTDKEEMTKAVATIRLPVSKVLSAETDKNDMSYENLAEIVQFTTLTGRRTNFATTIGNADITTDINKVPVGNRNDGTLEFVTAILEADTAATETITLIPPTGLMRNRRAIVNIVEATSVGVGFIFVLGTIAVILIMIITVILFVIRKYKKRRII